MSGGQSVDSPLFGHFEHFAEFNLRIAYEAGVGRSPVLIRADEVIDHCFSKFLLNIEDIHRNVEFGRQMRDEFSGMGFKGFAWALIGPATGFKTRKKVDADNIVTLLFQDMSRNQRVDAAAQCNGDCFFH